MQDKPNKWTGVILSLVGFQIGLGLFYVGAPWLAIASIAIFLGAGCLMFIGAWEAAYPIAIAALVLLTVALTYVLANRKPAAQGRGWTARWYGLVGMVVLYFLAALLIRAFLFEPFRVPSTAMEPGMSPGTMIVVKKWGYGHYSAFGVTLAERPPSAPLARGDLIVFDYPKDPSQTYIKRLVGLPGDRIEIKDNRLAVNGIQVGRRALDDYLVEDGLRYHKRYEETLATAKYHILHADKVSTYPYLEGALPQAGCRVDVLLLACTVPAEHYFMLGDNRDNSADSRMFGYVPTKLIIGKVVWSSQQKKYAIN